MLVVSFFFACLVTTEAMGIGGLRERSLSHSDKVNAGAKTSKLHVSQPMTIGVCYKQFFIFSLNFR
jgi:hypothetical protein